MGCQPSKTTKTAPDDFPWDVMARGRADANFWPRLERVVREWTEGERAQVGVWLVDLVECDRIPPRCERHSDVCPADVMAHRFVDNGRFFALLCGDRPRVPSPTPTDSQSSAALQRLRRRRKDLKRFREGRRRLSRRHPSLRLQDPNAIADYAWQSVEVPKLDASECSFLRLALRPSEAHPCRTALWEHACTAP
jgi:hypothetical protein